VRTDQHSLRAAALSGLSCQSRLLFWASLCFVFLAINNVILYFDLVILRQIDLFWYRNITALIGMLLLVFGLTWDSR
jgi:hypothetical protein